MVTQPLKHGILVDVGFWVSNFIKSLTQICNSTTTHFKSNLKSKD